MRFLGMLLFVLLLSIHGSVSGQQVYSPAKSSAERSAILAALRKPVEKDLKQPIVFVVDQLNVSGTWAFASGQPRTPSGGRPNLKGTAFEDGEDMFDDNFFGLLRKKNGKWSVVTHALGCTDVCYIDWWKTYRAPKAIFNMTDNF